MGRIIVPKNHILSPSTSYYSKTISSNSDVDLYADIYPDFIYSDDHMIIVDKTIKYSGDTGILISTTTDVKYDIYLFNDAAEDNKEVRFIKLTLSDFPTYKDTRTSGVTELKFSCDICKKYGNSADYTISKSFSGNLKTGNINGTYWLTFNPSTKKYSVSTTEPTLIYKAIVPQKDDWMDDTVTQYAPTINNAMTIKIEDTGNKCNQPYIGRVISIYNEPTSATSITGNTTYKLTINTADKILIINSILLGRFIGSQTITTAKLTFKIFINSNSTSVYTNDIQITGYTPGTVPKYHNISAESLYIDVMNNKTITSDDLYKAIDAF